jgi:hypothetical protein
MTSAELDIPTDGHLHVVPWDDPVVRRLGHDPRSEYAERFWLPVLGPSAMWFLRAVARDLDDEPAGFDLDLEEAASALGLSYRSSRHSALWRTVARCVTFRVARADGDGLAVRQWLPPLTQRQVVRLHEAAQAAHEQWSCEHGRPPAGPIPLDRAKSLAAALMSVGEPAYSVRQQLQRWRLPRPMAVAVTDWAREQLEPAG